MLRCLRVGTAVRAAQRSGTKPPRFYGININTAAPRDFMIPLAGGEWGEGEEEESEKC